MSTHYQLKIGDNDWTAGAVRYSDVWPTIKDHLRFHDGEGFHIRRMDGDWGPKRNLRQVHRRLEKRLDRAPVDTVFMVQSLKDHWDLKVRRHTMPLTVAEHISGFSHDQIGDPYILGAAGPNAWDCSGLTMVATKTFTGISLVHKATLQMRDPRMHSITRAQIKPMDMLFLHGNFWSVAHVAYFLDWNGPGGTGRVIDAEPHDTGAPSGWPTPNLGTGVRIRPMIAGYYCGWENLVKIGRLYAVNGKP